MLWLLMHRRVAQGRERVETEEMFPCWCSLSMEREDGRNTVGETQGGKLDPKVATNMFRNFHSGDLIILGYKYIFEL